MEIELSSQWLVSCHWHLPILLPSAVSMTCTYCVLERDASDPEIWMSRGWIKSVAKRFAQDSCGCLSAHMDVALCLCLSDCLLFHFKY